MRRFHISLFLLLCLVMAALSACKPTPNQPVASSPQAVQDATATDQTLEGASTAEPSEDSSVSVPKPDPLNNLLDLRAIRITQVGLRPDGTSRAIQVEIDAIGNMHLVYTPPGITSEDLVEGTDISGISFGYEIFVIDGKAYAPTEEDTAWKTTPVDPDYIPVLKDQMHGLEGFTTWLDILPAGSLQAAGNETMGGFTTNKYEVLGVVDGQQITGALWYDQEMHSLVKAELHVPAVLNSDPANPESGEYLITLVAEKADIPLITLP